MAFRFEDTGTQTAHGLTLNTFAAASAGALNSYAHVTAINGNQITINQNDILYGAYEDFSVGVDILFHVSASAATTYKTYLGCYCVATITAVENGVLTLDKDVTQVIPADEFGRYQVQVVTIARFGNLTLNSGVSIVPPAYSTTHFYGGIVAIKCFGNLTFAGGHINLVDRGLPVSATSMRPKTSQEEQGTLDTDTYSGWENSQTHERFLLNCGDGAAFILVRGTMNISNTASRIGNPSTNGAQFCRGASDSVGDKPDNVTNIGGSTILIAAQKITNFTPALIAKYRAANVATGQGICRCYIASESKLRNDEGLYAYDCISDPTRLFKELNIRNFGNGALGVCSTNAKQNNYAKVVAISADRKSITYADKTTDGVAQITKGALVMIHATHRETPPDEGNEIAANTGTFRLANVLNDTGTVLTLDSPTIDLSPTTYAIQVVSIPQYTDCTAQQRFDKLKFDGDKGGIFAIACNGDFGGTGVHQENMLSKVGTEPYGRGGLRYIGNAQMYNRLPIGAGVASIFVLAKTMNMDAYLTKNSKMWFGPSIKPNSDENIVGGEEFHNHTIGGYKGVLDAETDNLTEASGAAGAKGSFNGIQRNGGYGSNGDQISTNISGNAGLQGAHIMIIADTITEFNQWGISTGGMAGNRREYLGGAGYGGGAEIRGTGSESCRLSSGGYNGGGSTYGTPSTKTTNSAGGSSGWAFVYCNNAVDQKLAYTVLFD